ARIRPRGARGPLLRARRRGRERRRRGERAGRARRRPRARRDLGRRHRGRHGPGARRARGVMARLTLVRPGFYQDSVAALPLARDLRARPGVVEAAALMGTPANRDLLAQAGLLTEEAAAAGPNDLVVVIDAEPDAAEATRARAEELLSARRARRERGGHHAA